jgi:CHAT domain-containing protein
MTYLKRVFTVYLILTMSLLLNLYGISKAEEDSQAVKKWNELNDKTVQAYKQGDYKSDIKFTQKAYQYAQEAFGEKHPSTLLSMNNLAALYDSQGRYGEAEPLYQKALQLTQEVLGKEHPRTLTTNLNYAVCLVNLKKDDLAIGELKKLEKQFLLRADLMLYTSQQEKLRRQFLFTSSDFQDAIFTMAKDRKTNRASQELAADVVIHWKQMQGEEDAFIAHIGQINQDPKVKALVKEINDLRSQLTQSIHCQPPECTPSQGENQSNRSEALLENLEKKELDLANIAKNYKEYKNRLKSAAARADDVKSSLSPSGALIEFKVYRLVDFKRGKLGEFRLVAILFLPDQTLVEDVGSVEEIVKIANAMQSAKDLQSANDQAKQLYQRLLGKFDESIKDLKTVYIGPDGFLHLLSFDRLVLPDNRYLIARQEVRRVLTGRDLLYKDRASAPDSILAFGGIDFNRYPPQDSPSPGAETPTLVQKPATMQLALLKADEIKGKGFDDLPSSKIEAETIVGLYKDARHAPGESKTGAEASETALKALTKAPRTLHLSTHGFYRDNEALKNWTGDKALALSALALAGANLGLKGKTSQSGEDGILYGLEIAGLNLAGTELVTLSACETGVGAIDYSDGIYAASRAFKVAGAKSILMTIRTVGDKESRKFLEAFYEKWLSKKEGENDPVKALGETKLDYIEGKGRYKDDKEKEQCKDPAFWSPYVMVSD